MVVVIQLQLGSHYIYRVGLLYYLTDSANNLINYNLMVNSIK